ncbi:PEP-CTERM sorting domain-containing protein [Roseateles sp. BYS78W]|uniref:PEP-CTERM sorting domain-containing protein n=1 Tax=Pelomonas candidula TaxID=3299025 RepID=A0ABW7HIY7_9BURK
MQRVPSLFRSLHAAVAGATLALCALSAQAGFQSAITVKLIAPGGYTDGTTTDTTPISAQQVVSVADLATGLHAGGSGAVENWMLNTEEITFVDNSIHVRSFAGADEGAAGLFTGYLGSGGAHALYEFDGLSIAGKTIVGFTVSAFDNYADSGFSGLAGPSAGSLVHQIGADALSFDLDSIMFVNRGTGTGNAYADFRIDLILQDSSTGGGGKLPEPATLALFAVAALGARAAQRRKAARG